MVGRAFVFRTVVGVNALNQVGAGINQVFGQKLGGTVCGLSGKMAAYSSLEKSSMATNRSSRLSVVFLTFEQRQPFGIEMYLLSLNF